MLETVAPEKARDEFHAPFLGMCGLWGLPSFDTMHDLTINEWCGLAGYFCGCVLVYAVAVRWKG
jgi:hypothetical protein